MLQHYVKEEAAKIGAELGDFERGGGKQRQILVSFHRIRQSNQMEVTPDVICGTSVKAWAGL